MLIFIEKTFNWFIYRYEEKKHVTSRTIDKSQMEISHIKYSIIVNVQYSSRLNSLFKALKCYITPNTFKYQTTLIRIQLLKLEFSLNNFMRIQTPNDCLHTIQKHRVMLPKDRSRWREPRQSIVCFVHPDADCLVQCIDGSRKYPDVKASDYLQQRFYETFDKDQKDKEQ